MNHSITAFYTNKIVSDFFRRYKVASSFELDKNMASRAFRFVKQSVPKNCARRVFCSEKTPNNVQVTASGNLPTTHKLNIVDTAEYDKWPAYRILTPTGELAEGVPEPPMDATTANHYYKMMCQIQAFDDVFYNAQRQGRVSFYMQNIGEEAIQVGSASALDPNDMVFAQYPRDGRINVQRFFLSAVS